MRGRSSAACGAGRGSAGRCARWEGRPCGSAAAGRGERRAGRFSGAWPSGKARDFGSRIRRFESSRPSHRGRGGSGEHARLVPRAPAARHERFRARPPDVSADGLPTRERIVQRVTRSPPVDPCRIFAGNASRTLAKSICEKLKVPLGDADVTRFEDGEVSARFNENIRGSDVFIVQSTGAPADHLMELLVMLDAAKRASARRVTAVVPYFGYARQDRKDQPRAPITAKLVANLITVAGADRALAMALHSPQIQGFFDIPFDHLYAAPVLIDYFDQKRIGDLLVVAPDIGSVKMARAYAKRLGAELALVDKRRPRADAVEILNV